MSDSKSSSASGGLGICSVVTVVFVILKLVGVAPIAGWSWLWVLSPLWIGAAVTIGLLVLFLVFAALFTVIAKR